MAIIIVAVCIGTRLVQRSVTEPLAYITQVARPLAGDPTLHISTDRRMKWARPRALDQMSDSLAELVGQVQRSAGSIGAASVEIAPMANHDLSNRTEATAAHLQRVVHAGPPGGAVGQSAASAREANALAASAFTVAQSGGQSVSEVVQTMHRIDHSSKKIVDIIAVIDGIAFQTNILALNAAVEAARAGEQARLCRGGQRGALARQALGRGRARGQGADFRLGGERGGRHGAGGPCRADHAGDRAVGAACQRNH